MIVGLSSSLLRRWIIENHRIIFRNSWRFRWRFLVPFELVCLVQLLEPFPRNRDVVSLLGNPVFPDVLVAKVFFHLILLADNLQRVPGDRTHVLPTGTLFHNLCDGIEMDFLEEGVSVSHSNLNLSFFLIITSYSYPEFLLQVVDFALHSSCIGMEKVPAENQTLYWGINRV